MEGPLGARLQAGEVWLQAREVGPAAASTVFLTLVSGSSLAWETLAFTPEFWNHEPKKLLNIVEHSLPPLYLGGNFCKVSREVKRDLLLGPAQVLGTVPVRSLHNRSPISQQLRGYPCKAAGMATYHSLNRVRNGEQIAISPSGLALWGFF